MLSLIVAASLCQASAVEQRLRPTELSLGLTGVGSAYTFRGGRTGDFSLGPDVRATAVLSGFTVHGSFLHSVPFDRTGATAASTFTARLGYTSARVQLQAGAVMQLAADATPKSQLLPSLRAEAKFTERLRFSLALFDNHGFAPLQLAWEQERFFVGYVAPLGLSGGFRAAVSDEVSLEVRALALRLFNSEFAVVTVSGVLGAAR